MKNVQLAKRRREVLVRLSRNLFDRVKLAAALTRKAKLHHHFTNIHPNPDELCRWDSNGDKQKSDPEWYGPYLKEGEKYNLPRTKENVEKACKEAGLDDLPEKYKGERDFYRKLIYDHWVCFDGILRPICGVEIDLDLSDVKPIRQSPYHLSPAKTLIAKELINGFIKEGIVKSATSEWAFPIVIVPKGGTLKPGERTVSRYSRRDLKSWVCGVWSEQSGPAVTKKGHSRCYAGFG